MAASASTTSGARVRGAAGVGEWDSGAGAEVCEWAAIEAKSRTKIAERSTNYLSYQFNWVLEVGREEGCGVTGDGRGSLLWPTIWCA
jgi:hypothetical protein